MKNLLKTIGKMLLSKKTRLLLYKSIPRLQITYTYLLKKNQTIDNLYPIDKKFCIRELTYNDREKLKEVYGDNYSFRKSILPRLITQAWVGMAVFDTSYNCIAYVSWVIKENIDFINEFGIYLKPNQFFLRHGFCIPEYRHQGLHTRMEQERINYCVRNGANEIFIQIAKYNIKGINSVLTNGFEFYQQNIIFRIGSLGIYREFFSFIKRPFRHIT